MKLSEFANEMSDIISGCRETDEETMLARARELVEIERQSFLVAGTSKITNAIDKLRLSIEEVEQGDYDDE